MRRLYAVLASILAATVAAGCGGTTGKSSGGIGESGASMVRSGALAYLALDSDLSSDQWQKADHLLRKFPSRDRWLRQLKDELAKQNLDYDRDVKPALGPEVDVAAATGAAPRSVSYAVLTKPDSIEKAKALIAKLDARSAPADKSASRVVGDWVVVSDSEKMIDDVLKGSAGNSLADDSTFKSAMAELPGDALAKGYVNGRQLGDLAGSFFGGIAETTAAGGSGAPFGLDKLDWLAGALEAKDNGIRFEGDVNGAGGSRLTGGAPPYTSKLLSGVPGDALAFLTFRGASNLGDLQNNSPFGQQFGQFERMLGVNLGDVLALLQHEVAFYVRRGPGLPEFSLALEAPDLQRSLATIDHLASSVARLTHTTVSSEQQGGVDAKTLDLKRVTVRWAGFGERVLITTGPTGIGDYRAQGDKLADAAAYKDALDAAGAPDKTGGLVYLNLHDGVQLIESYAGLSGGKLPPEVRENVKPLQSFVAFNTTSGDLTKLVAFLELK